MRAGRLRDHWATTQPALSRGGRAHDVAHPFTAEQWAEAHVRLFSEWLRSHPIDRDRYCALKADLVREWAWQEGRYTTWKAAFVLEIVNQAQGARSLPPVTEPL